MLQQFNLIILESTVSWLMNLLERRAICTSGVFVSAPMGNTLQQALKISRSECAKPRSSLGSCTDRDLQIWDIAKKHIRNVFDGHQQEIYSLDFSLDGRLIVSGSGDKTARIWDMVDGTSKVLMINDADPVNNDAGVTSVAISPNGQLVAAGSLDTVVRIWDVRTGLLLERLRGHKDSVYSVAFTPDGKGLVSGSLDKTLKYWDVSGLVGKRKEPAANGKKDDRSSQCTMNFVGHTVSPRSSGTHHSCHNSFHDPGLRAFSCCVTRRAVGCVRVKGPRCPVLGLALRDDAMHASRS